MRVFIIRHPQTKWNEKNRVQGHLDSELTKKGVVTAHALGSELEDKNITKIYTSDLGRCKRTAEIINNYLHKEIIPLKDLRERNFGAYNGVHNDKIEPFLQEDFNHKMPQGESVNQMRERFLETLHGIAEDDILIVTHEGCVRTLLSIAKDADHRSSTCDSNASDILIIDINKDHIAVESVINTVKPHTNNE